MCHKNLLFIALICIKLTWGQEQPLDEETIKKYNAIFGTYTPSSTTATITTTEEELSLNPGIKPKGEVKCKREDGREGVCVTYYQCDPETKKAITDGATLIDVRMKECDSYLHVCCLVDDVNTASRLPEPSAPPAQSRGCGYGNKGAQAFRINNDDGTKAEYGEYPWMVAILRLTDPGATWSSNDYIGGGSIIHPKVVLTGAHKVDGKEARELKCRAGEWDTQTDLEYYPFQERDVDKIVIHEDFYRASVLNNVALLFLEKPFEINLDTPHMGVACIGRTVPAAGTVCESMGWGKNDFNNDAIYAVILKRVALPLVKRQTCQNALRGTRLGTRFQLHQSFICAGGEKGLDTCSGDGGSPLVCPLGNPKDTRYTIVGTVAWGIGCGEEGTPGVYTNIPDFKGWIDRKMKDEKLETK